LLAEPVCSTPPDLGVILRDLAEDRLQVVTLTCVIEHLAEICPLFPGNIRCLQTAGLAIRFALFSDSCGFAQLSKHAMLHQQLLSRTGYCGLVGRKKGNVLLIGEKEFEL
jgi:hypothetical protein